MPLLVIAHERLHALDTVRAFALLSGIVLHATMSFFFIVPTRDQSPSDTLGVVFYILHIFRMATFYLIAGFFARLGLERRGVRAFARDRAMRIVVPMVGGWLIFGTLSIALTIWGLRRTFGHVDIAAIQRALIGDGFPLAHLWFLYYLCIFYLCALGARRVVDAIGNHADGAAAVVDGVVRRILRTSLAPLLLGAPLAAVMYFDPDWRPWFGIPTPVGFVPRMPAMIGYGTAFAFGWVLHRQRDQLSAWRQTWAIHVVSAALVTIGCLWIVGIAPDLRDLTSVPGAPWRRAAYAIGYAACVWLWTAAVVGAALRFWSAESAVRRYLADSSYWLYLAHVPVVFFLQIVSAAVPLHWTIKFPLLLAIALAVLLMSYHYLVRPTFLGLLLNGRKYSREAGVWGAARRASL